MKTVSKPGVLVTREVFDETLEYLRRHCEVQANQDDTPYAPEALAAALKEQDGLMCCLTDRVDTTLLAAAPRLRAVANIAVGYNNIDVPACTARGVMATNTPGVLDDSTADLAWALMLGTARRITEVERRVRAGEWTGWQLKQWLGVDVHHATLGIDDGHPDRCMRERSLESLLALARQPFRGIDALGLRLALAVDLRQRGTQQQHQGDAGAGDEHEHARAMLAQGQHHA